MSSSDRVRPTVEEARAHCERALCGIGYDAEEARIVEVDRAVYDALTVLQA
jgi:hypothetical protein